MDHHTTQRKKTFVIIQLYLPISTYGLFTKSTQQYQALLRDQKEIDPDVKKYYEKDLINQLQQINTDEIVIIQHDLRKPIFHNTQDNVLSL